MAFDAFLKLDDIPGGSADRDHKDWIEVESFSWGIEFDTSIGSSTGGAGAGKAKFNDLSIVANFGKASETLFKTCATGQHIKKAVLHVRKAGGGQDVFYKVHFDTVLISSFQDGGTSDGVTEEIKLVFGAAGYGDAAPSE